jgi:hypothetical protein
MIDYVFAIPTWRELILLPVLGYIDPNTGGMLFQILAVIFATLSGIFLVFSGRIKGAFYKIKRRISKQDQAEPQTRMQDGKNPGSPEDDLKT